MNWFVAGVVAMAVVVAVSNYLVQLQINDWLTWASFSYPIAFLVTDLINRRLGPGSARRVVYVGFACGVALSLLTSTARIALASGTAFLLAQLADVWLYNRLRGLAAWWQTPLILLDRRLGARYRPLLQPRLRVHRGSVGDPGHRRLRRKARGGVRDAGPVPADDGGTRPRTSERRIPGRGGLIGREAGRAGATAGRRPRSDRCVGASPACRAAARGACAVIRRGGAGRASKSPCRRRPAPGRRPASRASLRAVPGSAPFPRSRAPARPPRPRRATPLRSPSFARGCGTRRQGRSHRFPPRGLRQAGIRGRAHRSSADASGSPAPESRSLHSGYPSAVAVSTPHAAIPSTGRRVARRASASPGSLKQAMMETVGAVVSRRHERGYRRRDRLHVGIALDPGRPFFQRGTFEGGTAVKAHRIEGPRRHLRSPPRSSSG